jgi:3-oxoacyl-[acyl-carrier protein] reductase
MNEKHLIFGATGGIGSEVCRQLRASNQTVAASGRNQSGLAELSKEIGALTFPGDALEWETAADVVAQAKSQMNGLDGVAICIGSLLLKPAHLTTREEFDEVLGRNLSAAFGIVRAAVKAMMPAGGSIVLVSSAAARTGIRNHDAIAAAKAGIIGLTLSAAATYAPRRIRVNCVAPGMVESPLTGSLLATPAHREASAQMHPLGRIGQPAEVARTIAWLLSPLQGWITGQVIGVDGGLGSVLPTMRAGAK